MKRLMIESYRFLLLIEFVMKFRSLSALHRLVERAKVQTLAACAQVAPEELRRAIDLACVFYPKRVMCLQRSAATTLLFRRHGIRAEMVIGVRALPFKSHAWVEAGCAVVNDKPYIREIYRVMERC